MALRVALAVNPRSVPAWAGDLRSTLGGLAGVEVLWRAVEAPSITRPAWRDALEARAMRLQHSSRATVALRSLTLEAPAAAGTAYDVAIACGVHPAAIGPGRVWALDHALPGLEDPIDADVVGGAALTVTVVRRWQGGRSDRVLYAENSQVDPRSPVRGAAHRDAKAVAALARLVARLQATGSDEWPRHQDDALADEPAARRGSGAIALVQHLGRFVADAWARRVVLDQWQLSWQLTDAELPSPRRWSLLKPPRDRFWADPMLVRRDGETWLFFEDADLATGHGRIAVAPMTEQGLGTPRTALAEPFHLSYPHVFEHEGTWYMLPETSAAKRISLYRCTSWPDRWERDAVLMDGVRACDATVLRHDGRWWMFAAVRAPGAQHTDGLHLFMADELRGPWRPHEENPVRRDLRSARPAGAILRGADGALLRPAQDCSGRYGRAWSLWNIETLSDRRYAERLVATHHPGYRPDVVGTHTYGRIGNLHVSDAAVRVRRRASAA